jgi:hypothetical protein
MKTYQILAADGRECGRVDARNAIEAKRLMEAGMWLNCHVRLVR